jgi:protein transport protein SEC24
MSTDVRVHYIRLLKSISLPQSVLYLYPKLYVIHQLISDDSIIISQLGKPRLPTPLRISFERFESHGLYLLENGFALYLYIGREASPMLLRDVFGVDNLEQVNSKAVSFNQIVLKSSISNLNSLLYRN